MRSEQRRERAVAADKPIDLDNENAPQARVRKTQYLGKTRDGFAVLELEQGRVQVPSWAIRQALNTVDTNGQKRIEATVDLGKVVGLDSCMETLPGDDVFFAKMVGSGNWMRFVRREQGEETTKVFLSMRKMRERPDKDPAYAIVVSYAGEKAERSPDDKYFRNRPDEREDALDFWEDNALDALRLDKRGLIQRGTETREYPWA